MGQAGSSHATRRSVYGVRVNELEPPQDVSAEVRVVEHLDVERFGTVSRRSAKYSEAYGWRGESCSPSPATPVRVEYRASPAM